MPESSNVRRDGPPGASATALLEPLGVALLKMPEAERYRLLGTFLVDLAGRHEAGARQPSTSEVEALSKRLQRLGEEKAQLDDALAAMRADLAHHTTQLEAERQRSQEMERIVADQRARLQAAQQEQTALEAQVVAKDAQLQVAESDAEALRVKLQRTELKAGDTSRAAARDEDCRQLGMELEQARHELEHVRAEKDAELERLKAQLVETQSAAGTGAESLLAALWDRLARAKPALANAGTRPNDKAAERFFDAFIELAHFVTDFDLALRPYLRLFTRHNPAIARPWDVYEGSAGLPDALREVVDPERGKPASVLKLRTLLRQGPQRWLMAAIVGSDIALESIAHELEQQLFGPVGMGKDPNRRLKEYLRDSGHELFQQHIRELRSQKLAEAYTHGHGG